MLGIVDFKFQSSLQQREKITLAQLNGGLGLLRSPNVELLDKYLCKINQCFEDSQSRYDGLILLYSLVKECPENVFRDYAFSWTEILLQTLETSNSTNSKELSYIVLKDIISNVALYPEMKNDFAEKHLSTIISLVLKTLPEDQWIKRALECLAMCMKELSGSCIQHKNDIQTFLISKLDCLFCHEIEPVAKCFSHLPAICERATNETFYVAHWKELVEKILGSLNKLINFMYMGIQETNISEYAKSLDFPPEPEDEFCAMLTCHRRFQSLSRCLAMLLCSETSYIMHIPVNHILIVIDQAVEIDYAHLNKIKHESNGLEAILPSIHTSALVMLEALIMSCHESLMTKVNEIGDILFTCLSPQWIMIDHVSEEINSDVLRSTAYRVIQLWIEKIRPKSIRNLSVLLAEILKDIKPKNSIHGKSMGLFSPRLRPSARLSGFDEMEKFRTHTTCIDALSVLSTLLCNMEIGWFNSGLKDFPETFVNIVFRVQCGRHFPAPYCENQCRLQLYKTFLHVVSATSGLISLPAVIRIFHKGKTDECIEISRFCCEAVMMCQNFIHPIRVSRECQLKVQPPVQVDTGNLSYYPAESSHYIPSTETVLRPRSKRSREKESSSYEDFFGPGNSKEDTGRQARMKERNRAEHEPNLGDKGNEIEICSDEDEEDEEDMEDSIKDDASDETIRRNSTKDEDDKDQCLAGENDEDGEEICDEEEEDEYEDEEMDEEVEDESDDVEDESEIETIEECKIEEEVISEHSNSEKAKAKEDTDLNGGISSRPIKENGFELLSESKCDESDEPSTKKRKTMPQEEIQLEDEVEAVKEEVIVEEETPATTETKSTEDADSEPPEVVVPTANWPPVNNMIEDFCDLPPESLPKALQQT